MSRAKDRPDIETLLADRARFEAWLDQLMAKASQMPAHVVERVRADYDQRLAAVVDDLRSRADDLRAEANALDERIEELDRDLGSKRDARAEDELRALVGEFDDAVWTAKAAEHDDSIGRLDAERNTRQAELMRVRELLDEATRPSRAMRAISAQDIPEEPTPVSVEVAPEPEAQPEPTEPELALEMPDPAPSPAFEPVASSEPAVPDVAPLAPELPLEPVAADAPRSSGAIPESPAARRPSPFDEIGFLRTVVGRATPYGGVPVPLEPAPAPPALEPEPALAAAPAPAPVTPPPPAPRQSIPNFQPPPIPDPAPAPPPRISAQAVPMFGEPLSSGAAEEDSSLRLSRGTTEAARSLKCQECGWMNFPTEWYCEKCGGELAAF